MQYAYQMQMPQIPREEAKNPRVEQLRQNAQMLQINANVRIISHEPVIVKCPHCNQTGVTTVRKQSGVMIWVSAIVCCLIGMGPCALVPWCIKDLKDTIHECHYCGNVVAVVKRHEN